MCYVASRKLETPGRGGCCWLDGAWILQSTGSRRRRELRRAESMVVSAKRREIGGRVGQRFYNLKRRDFSLWGLYSWEMRNISSLLPYSKNGES